MLVTELSPVEEKEKEKDHPDAGQVKQPPAVVEPVISPTERSRSHTRVHKSASASALTLLIPPHGAFCALPLCIDNKTCNFFSVYYLSL